MKTKIISNKNYGPSKKPKNSCKKKKCSFQRFADCTFRNIQIDAFNVHFVRCKFIDCTFFHVIQCKFELCNFPASSFFGYAEFTKFSTCADIRFEQVYCRKCEIFSTSGFNARDSLFDYCDINNCINAEITTCKIVYSYIMGNNNTKFENNYACKSNIIIPLDENVSIKGLYYSCPTEGSFIAWKKVQAEGKSYLVKLLVPEDAKRCCGQDFKCRCSKAQVLAITDIESGEEVESVLNKHISFPSTFYKLGETVYPDSFEENRWKTCSHGIHFFVDKQAALEYNN